MAQLRERLAYTVDLRIPHFYHTVPIGTVGQRSFENLNTTEWYERFKRTCLESINKRYFPVFRVSDGEFYFTTGFRAPYPPKGTPIVAHYLRWLLGSIRLQRFPWRFRSGAPAYGWEEFSGREWFSLRKEFVNHLKQISQKGSLAVNFTITEPPFAEQYFDPFCDWLDNNAILLSPTNYYPFYFVYALLNGPDSNEIIADRNVLIVISYDDAKRSAITKGLIAAGASSVEFISISRNKAMKDVLDLSTLSSHVDVVLVGAGVGASNVLCQLESLGTLVIDAGFCLECIADPKKKLSRVFCTSDES